MIASREISAGILLARPRVLAVALLVPGLLLQINTIASHKSKIDLENTRAERTISNGIKISTHPHPINRQARELSGCQNVAIRSAHESRHQKTIRPLVFDLTECANTSQIKAVNT